MGCFFACLPASNLIEATSTVPANYNFIQYNLTYCFQSLRLLLITATHLAATKALLLCRVARTAVAFYKPKRLSDY